MLLFCEVEPEGGGETPIVLSHVVYEKMKQIHPAFVAQLEEHGLLYTRLLNGDDDLTSPSGRGWRSTFSTHDKTIAEQRFDSIHHLFSILILHSFNIIRLFERHEIR